MAGGPHLADPAPAGPSGPGPQGGACRGRLDAGAYVFPGF